MKQCILIADDINEIFSLPCVDRIQKTNDGQPLYEVCAENALFASPGQWICQDEDRILILSAEEKDEFIRKHMKGGAL